MIRTLLTTTAIAVLMGTSAYAQDTTTTAPATTETAPAATDSMAPAAGSTDSTTSTDTMAPAATDAAPAATDDAAAPAAGGTDAMDNNAMGTDAMDDTEMSQPWDMSAGYTRVDSDNLATKLIGMPVYSSAGEDAEEIGSVNDLVFTQDGQISAVVIGVGGFLGIGEKNVAVDFKSLEFTIAADNTERWVVPTTADALNAAPEFTWEDDEPADAGMAPADGGAMAPAPADGGAMAPAAPAADPAAAPAAPAN